ncbi:ergosterol biosynthesis ERG4/ERG24 [Baffinella frigidus]|nr:ergosterol biosynthesis ERG4/ERG24 [Cryptophyta sp. CCMP2293]
MWTLDPEPNPPNRRCFVGAKVQNLENRASGNAVYDFFLGTYLNPRVGSLDIKMWAEIRVSWCLLFLLTLGSAYKQYETQGQVSNSIIFLAVAHWLYANACHKGEECIPTTWDIFHENFGWYLAFWNLAGVPFTYSFQAQFLIHNDPINYSLPVICLFFAALLGAYWVWDTANSQKNRFRMHLRGAKWQEWTFPQLPWGTLKDPHFITTHNGGTILADGWYRFGRKIHYTADIVMAFLWGAICGFDAFLPFFYCLFFTTFITHRYFRDVDRMKAKYGKYWDEYTKECPYVFIPYVW